MTEFINVTIDGKKYEKYKNAYDALVSKKHAINFGDNGSGFYTYDWQLYTTDEAIEKMAKNYEFMMYKHDEELRKEQATYEEKTKFWQEFANERSKDVIYWEKRCLLAEKCFDASPCDPDVTKEQIEAHANYNTFIAQEGKRG